MKSLHVRALRPEDIPPIAEAFTAVGWDKPEEQYRRYLAEGERGEREVLVAFAEGDFAGYLTIVWLSSYAPFREAGIPEIVDFNVFPAFRRRGIGTRLMAEAERRIAERSPVAGIGVGMDADYGAAQRLYVRRGYVPDGRGLMSHGQPVEFGQMVQVDDGLALYFTRRLG